MALEFKDNPQKCVVREEWDTPVIELLSREWAREYLYFGLPGPKAIDVTLWRDLLRRVIAFELEAKDADDPRSKVVELTRVLTLLGLDFEVFFGPLEEVLLSGEDLDQKPFRLQDFVTLFNLDFCNAITGGFQTLSGRHFLRFEALRQIVAIQRDLYRKGGFPYFVLLLTVHASFNKKRVISYFDDVVVQPEIAQYVSSAVKKKPYTGGTTVRHPDVLKAFVFSCLGDYLRGQNVSAYFLPPVTYQGTSANSPMIHFFVIGHMNPKESAGPRELQSAKDFLDLQTLTVDRDKVVEARDGSTQVFDPLAFVNKIRFWPN